MTFTVTDACAYIAKVRWQFARTMPQWPHEYTVRVWREDLDDEFLAFVGLIRREGTVKPWPREALKPRYHHTYLEIEGWEYWTMEAAVVETTLINRARTDVESLARADGIPLDGPVAPSGSGGAAPSSPTLTAASPLFSHAPGARRAALGCSGRSWSSS